MSNENELLAIINNWNYVDLDRKQKAANEFFDRYNKNHFTDILEELK